MRRLPLAFLAAAALSCALPARAQEPGTVLALDTGPVLTLDDAIRLALQRNKNLKVVAYERPIARADLLIARGKFDPSLVFTRTAEQNYADATTSPPPLIETIKTDITSIGIQGTSPIGTLFSITGNSVNNRYMYSGYANNIQTFGGFNVTQPLLKGFGFAANLVQVRIAKAQRAISDYDYLGSAITTVTNVVLAYSNLQLAHDALASAVKSRALAQSSLADNQKSYRIGSVSQSDLITARSFEASLEESVIVADRSVHDAENALRELVGEETFFEDKPLFRLVPVDPPEVTIDRRADLARALRLRPDYQAARLGIVQRRATEAAANNGLLPEVDFVGGYGYNGLGSTLASSRQMVGDGLNPSFSAGVAVTIPLTFAVGRGTARDARLRREQSEADLRRFEADIAINVATTEGQIEAARKRVVADRAAYALAQQALDAEEKKKRAGTSTTLAVVQQQQLLTAVENNVSFALASERQAVALYDQALGSTLERYHIQLSSD
jgi:outer membrane protein TolC